MSTKSFREKINHSFKRTGHQAFLFIFGLFIVMAAAQLIRNALEWITSLHWSLGLLGAVLVLTGLCWILKWIKTASYTPDSFGYYPRLGLILNLFLIVFGAMVAMAFVSYILFELDFVKFTSSDPVTVSRLLDYYGWHFIDSVPIFAIWDTFGIESRITASDTGARALLEVFRVLIVATVIQIFMSKRGNFRRQLKIAQVYRSSNDYHKAELTMDVALKSAERSDDPVKLADAHIEIARIFINDLPEKAKTHLDQALRFVKRAADEVDLKARRAAIISLENEIK